MSAIQTFTPTSTSLSPLANTPSDVEREQYGTDYFMTQEFTAQPVKKSVLVETETQSQTSAHQTGKRTFQFKKGQPVQKFLVCLAKPSVVRKSHLAVLEQVSVVLPWPTMTQWISVQRTMSLQVPLQLSNKL